MRCFNHGATLISIPSPPAGYHDCNCPSCSSSADTLVSLEGERDEGFDALRHASDYQFIARLLNLAEAYHSFGIRCYYFSVLVVSYLWGPLALVACTFVLIGFLRIVDLDDLPMGES
ncbi:hypothetical protein HDU82_005515 [Entophlyctis luteolus]|nr:hypothetical protein HDU82_005515 [Entophlyctis luteolus]KAJ3388622.1 hypothetical protein HDU84_009628 [Entophlyctis sp. JEL0112]